MNNIEISNFMILKWLVVKKSQKLALAKVFRPQDFCFISQFIKLMARNIGKFISQQIF